MIFEFSLIGWRVWPAEEEVGDKALPGLGFLQPVQRRRLSPNSRMLLDALHEQPASAPVVHVTRYGEYDRAFEVLVDLAAENPASPAAFATSVHNTPAALHAIFAGAGELSTTITAAEATLEAGIVEAVALLDEGHEQVSVVLADAPLPDVYPDATAFADQPRLIALSVGGAGTRCRVTGAASADVEPVQIADYTAFLSGAADRVSHADGRLRWTWEWAA